VSAYLDRRRRWEAYTRGHLEAMGAQFPVRIACQRWDAILRRTKTARGRMRTLGGQMALSAMFADLRSGPCVTCGVLIGWPASFPHEPLKICLRCAKKAIRPGSIIPVDLEPVADPPLTAPRRSGKTRT